MRKILTLLMFLLITNLNAAIASAPSIEQKVLFDYDLHVTTLPGTSKRVMLCFHGYGGDYKIASSLRNLKCIEATLIGFNFPDYNLKQRPYDYRKATFGTINELLPALYVLKKTVSDYNLDSIDLYGFSAGGAALINVIRVLNTSTFNAKLETIGIGSAEKKRLLDVIQKGVMILDAPLKSIEEVMALRGSTDEFEHLAKNYRENDMRPIDSIKWLKGLSLNILLHFQKRDEIVSNRDDVLFIERLQAVQPNALIIIGNDGGHLSYHRSLWKTYAQKMAQFRAAQGVAHNL